MNEKKLREKIREDIAQILEDENKVFSEITDEELSRWIKRYMHQYWE